MLRALAERADILMAGTGEARLLLGDADTKDERAVLDRLGTRTV